MLTLVCNATLTSAPLRPANRARLSMVWHSAIAALPRAASFAIALEAAEFEAVGQIATNTRMRKTIFLRDAHQRLAGTVVLNMRQVSMLIPTFVTSMAGVVRAVKNVANFWTSSDCALAAKITSLLCICI
jgi:hypothetical protein